MRVCRERDISSLHTVCGAFKGCDVATCYISCQGKDCIHKSKYVSSMNFGDKLARTNTSLHRVARRVTEILWIGYSISNRYDIPRRILNQLMQMPLFCQMNNGSSTIGLAPLPGA